MIVQIKAIILVQVKFGTSLLQVRVLLVHILQLSVLEVRV